MMTEKEEGILLGRLEAGFQSLETRMISVEEKLDKISKRDIRVAGFASGVSAAVVIFFKAIVALFTVKHGG